MSTASPFLATLSGFSDIVSQFSSGPAIFKSLVSYLVFSTLFGQNLTLGELSIMWVYLGDISVLIVCLISAGYLAVKSTAAAISFFGGYAKTYRNLSDGSDFGNYVAYFEVAFAILFIATSLGITIASLYGASSFWETVQLRVDDTINNGVNGRAVTPEQALKFSVLGFVVALSTWTTAYSLGETVDNLVTWWDEWSNEVDAGQNDSESEGRDKTSNDIDPLGTAAQFDFLYHAITTLVSWITFVAIMIGGDVFAFNYLVFKPLQNCDVENVDESYYAELRSIFASMDSDMATCKVASKKLLKVLDLDGDGYVSTCEDSLAMYAFGNSAEYALNYGESKTLAGLYQDECYTRFGYPGTGDHK